MNRSEGNRRQSVLTRGRPDAFAARRRVRPVALPPPSRALAVALGGALGSGARYLVSDAFPTPQGTFPWATFGINVSGAFLLGVAFTIFAERFPGIRHRQSFVCTGILGAYTTFSTFSVELVSLGLGLAVGYAITSLFAGMGGVLLGAAFARLRPVPPPQIDPDLGEPSSDAAA
jgi:CrcB protein